MSQFSANIRKEEGWWRKLLDADELARWYQVGIGRDWLVQTPSGHAKVGLSARQVRHKNL